MPAFSRDFEKTLSKAIAIADKTVCSHVRSEGPPRPGIHVDDIAKAKAVAVAKLAHEHQHPLHCVLEQQEV